MYGEDRPPRGGRVTRPIRGSGRGMSGSQRTGKREFERRSGSDKRFVICVCAGVNCCLCWYELVSVLV